MAKTNEVTLYLNTPNCVHFAKVPVLKPGANIWTRAEYNAVRKTEPFKRFIESNKIRVDEDNPVNTEGREISSAIAHVNQVMDLTKLRSFLEEESRPEVRAAILRQIEELKAPPEQSEPESGVDE